MNMAVLEKAPLLPHEGTNLQSSSVIVHNNISPPRSIQQRV